MFLGDRVCFSAFEVCLFRVAYVLAFFGAFWVSELVSPSHTKAGCLLEADVRFQGEILDCVICRSKTDQLGKGAMVGPLCVQWQGLYGGAP